jgi:hypothetical protein
MVVLSKSTKYKDMNNILNYLKEFSFIIFSIALVFLFVSSGIIIFFLPFGVGIYIEHSLNLNPFLCWFFTLFCYFFYWVIARRFNLIEKPF